MTEYKEDPDQDGSPELLWGVALTFGGTFFYALEYTLCERVYTLYKMPICDIAHHGVKVPGFILEWLALRAQQSSEREQNALRIYLDALQYLVDTSPAELHHRLSAPSKINPISDKLMQHWCARASTEVRVTLTLALTLTQTLKPNHTGAISSRAFPI